MRSPLLALLPLAAACASAPDTTSDPTPGGAPGDDFAARLVEAHGGPGWYAWPCLATRLAVDFGGERILDGEMLYEPATNRCRIDLARGGAIVFDGEVAWSSEGVPMARFHALTWPYFLGVPWKLGDEGARLDVEGERALDGTAHPTARLTFDAGTGDTPDDWYVLYADPESRRLDALAYIVTYGTPRDEAEEQPSIALYGGYRDLDGLLLPGELTFYAWSETSGREGEPKGRAAFTNLRVVTPPRGAFEPPPGAVRDALPQ